MLSLDKEDFSVKVRPSKDKQKDVGVIYYKNNPIYVFIRNTSVALKRRRIATIQTTSNMEIF